METVKLQDKPGRERVNVYIDGFNLYYGIKRAGWRHVKWLDLVKMSHAMLRPNQDLHSVRYFTTTILGRDKGAAARQRAYLEALKTLQPQLSLHYGQFKGDDDPCWKCEAPRGVPKEKMTDVKIALCMVMDGIQNQYDTAIVVTGDSDQVPTIQTLHQLKGGKRVAVAFPPSPDKKFPYALKDAADYSFMIKEQLLLESQFANTIVRAGKSTLRRPPEWE